MELHTIARKDPTPQNNNEQSKGFQDYKKLL
jgi:hypothetical protein